MDTFATWLDTLLDEKGIDPELHTLVVDTPGQAWEFHVIPLPLVIAACKAASHGEQAVIKNTLVRLDFCNAPILPYFQHLATAIAQTITE